MKDTSRRRLLAAAGFGTGLTTLSAGCLERLPETGTDESDEPDESNESDESDESDDSSPSDVTPLERWVPASSSAELLFHYRDLATVRRLEDDLRAGVVEDVPTVPDGDGSEVVERVADGESAVESVLRFGSEGVAGNVVAGSFDPTAVDAESESSVGEFAVRERDGVSVAVSAETVVVSPADGAALDAILAAGVEGTDRRVDGHDHFAQLLERVGDGTVLWGEYEGETAGSGAAFSWSLGSDTSAYSGVAVYANADRTKEFEETMSDRFDDVTVEVDGNVGVATRTVPTEEYEYQDLFAERGSEAMAGTTIEVDQSSRTITVTYTASGNADRLEVHEGAEKRETLTEVGQKATLEYDAGESGSVQAVAVIGETETLIASESFSF
ncbi:hypothetical protein [Natrinema amylolyticum]|uniref:hypothetical protein n=1 Tax=Natrinema amylolyticum TaxID=2878679 RepID=UPI001CF9FC31|nr:hypothetical protein [Natrinema amylolyticum]